MKKDFDLKRLIRVFIVIISIAILLVISFMVLGNAWYTIYFLDDFNHSTRIGAFHVGFFEYIKASFLFAKKMYMTWQGTYFSMFIQGLLSPLNNGGLIQLRIVMLANAFLFMFSLAFLINTLIRCLNKDIKFEIRLLIIALFFLHFFSSLEYPEVFSWFSGSTSYSFPLSFLFLSISLSLIAERKKNKAFLVFSIISGFFAMGGVLGITGMGCSFMLVIVVSSLLFNKKLPKYLFTVFSFDFAFALFATVAPGNFVRRSYVDKTTNPINISFLTLKKYFYGTESVFKDTGIIVIVLIFIVLGVVLAELVDKEILRKYLFTSIMMIIVPFTTLFPIILGYGGYYYFPNRCTFLLNITLTFLILNYSLLLGMLFGKILKEDGYKRVFVCCVSVLLIVVFIIFGKRLEENVAVIQINNLASGKIKTFYNEVNNILYEIETSPEEDVVLERNPYEVEHFHEFYISDDPEFGYNVDIAMYYGKKSVRMMHY